MPGMHYRNKKGKMLNKRPVDGGFHNVVVMVALKGKLVVRMRVFGVAEVMIEQEIGKRERGLFAAVFGIVREKHGQLQ